MDSLIPSTYEASRERFRSDFEALRVHWQNTRLEPVPLAAEPDLTIDVAWAEPSRRRTLVLVSTGVHGIEGYVGSAMLKTFMDEFAPRLDSSATGLLLVHAVNPWGMKHRRRYNENNVDLNRNFLWDEHFGPEINPAYDRLVGLLNPPRPVGSLLPGDAAFAARAMGYIARMGIVPLRQAILSGQYRHPRGIQFGGQSTQQGVEVMRALFLKVMEQYEQVIHLDMHTGYGPRYQISLVNSPSEPVSPAELARRFRYPLVVAATPDEFYQVSGDITEYLYLLRDRQFPGKKMFSTCLEAGTFGDSTLQEIRSLRATILENRLYQYGATTEGIRQAVRAEYEELFCPAEPRWREKVMSDCRQAVSGILADFSLA